MIRKLVGLGEFDAYYPNRELLIGLQFEVNGNRAMLISEPSEELTKFIEKRAKDVPISRSFFFHQPKWRKS